MKNSHRFIRKANIYGQSMFEVLVALTVIALITIAVVSLTVFSVRNNSYSRNRTLANNYAQEGMEWLRQQRDDKFSNLEAHAGKTWCLDNLKGGWSGGGGGCGPTKNIPDTIFFREFTLSTEGSSPNIAVIAKMVVKWTDTQGEHKVEIITKFTDWQNQI